MHNQRRRGKRPYRRPGIIDLKWQKNKKITTSKPRDKGKNKEEKEIKETKRSKPESRLLISLYHFLPRSRKLSEEPEPEERRPRSDAES